MGKLTHLRTQRPAPMQLVEGIIGAIGEDIARAVLQEIGPEFSEQTFNSHNIKRAVDGLGPEISKAISALGPKIDALAKELKSRAITHSDMVKLQGDLVKALSNVRIPDYSEQFRRLEARKVDLSPLLEKLDNLEVDIPAEEPRPTQWAFDIKRDRNGLIQSVTATAQD